MDFRKLALKDETFSLVVFDPPHVARAGKTSFVADKYGYLDKDTWQEDLRKGFAECFRVLKPDGVLVFKWNECHIPLKEILPLAPAQPLFGQRGGRSYNLPVCFYIEITELKHPANLLGGVYIASSPMVDMF